jgi:hypothetical protein
MLRLGFVTGRGVLRRRRALVDGMARMRRLASVLAMGERCGGLRDRCGAQARKQSPRTVGGEPCPAPDGGRAVSLGPDEARRACRRWVLGSRVNRSGRTALPLVGLA